MPAVWNSMRLNEVGESVVVIPSVTLDRVGERSGSLSQAFEERFLFLLLLLRQPRLRMIYVTSMPVAPATVEYYLALLPGVIPSHARARLSLVSVNDSSPHPLSEKLLERPRLLRQIAALIPDRSRSHLVPYNTTVAERDVALALGIPMYGADPRLFELGTKTGCRRLFAEEGVRHPIGIEDLHTFDELVDATVRLRKERPTVTEVIVKLNEGVSGEGNALVDLRSLSAAGDGGGAGRHRRPAAGDAVRTAGHALRRVRQQARRAWGNRRGAHLGRRVAQPERAVARHAWWRAWSCCPPTTSCSAGRAARSTSAAGSRPISPTLGPSAPTQRPIGARLAREGVLGRFAIDFVVVKDTAGEWTQYAIELNLRKGGTTHPFLTLQFLTDGRYGGTTGLFLTPAGREKHLVATDHLESPLLRGLSLDDLFDIVARHGLHFDQARQSGVVFHMISCITEHGRVGLTAVGDTPAQADEIYRRAERILLDEARGALEESALPG